METNATRRLQIFAGGHNTDFAAKVAKKLGVELCDSGVRRFANGELKCQLKESVRGGDVFVVQTHNRPVNDAIMEQAIIIDAARRASAKHITAVCPLIGYSRQDRKSSGREPITAKLVIDLLAAAGADRIVSVDLHAGQIQGYFDGPFDHLIAMPVLADYVKKKLGSSVVIVSPDAGRVKLAERYVSRIGAELAIVHKHRPRESQAVGLHIIGEVKGQDCVVIDDMIDTASTICAAAEILKKRGAKSITIIATHGLFSTPAQERIKKAPIDKIVVTDTVPLDDTLALKNIEIVSVVDLLASAIKAIFDRDSVSALFDGENQT